MTTPGTPLKIRFWDKVNKGVDCWEWTAAKISTGYGCINVDGKTTLAHRLAWEWDNLGPVPDGLEIDHTCRNRACVNPKHLEAVSHLENVRRAADTRGMPAINAAKTHCVRGHPFSEHSVKRTDPRSGRPYRQCMACVKIRGRKQ